MRTAKLFSTALALCALCAAGGFWIATHSPLFASGLEPAALAQDEQYAYHDPVFTGFVEESYQDGGGGDASQFFQWMEDAYANGKIQDKDKPGLGLEALADAKKEELDEITDPARKTAAVLELAEWLHRVVKSDIPKFSLDRGFEFRSVAQYGERQCFLQSVLVAGLLQRMGVEAGVAMVSRNLQGIATNNGHAVALVRLPDETDTIVDCSDPEPFVRQQGLFVRRGGYGYVYPVYRANSGIIEKYRSAREDKTVPPAQVRTLDVGFINSQFEFYRGERAPGGLVSAHPTADGLQRSAEHLKESVRRCPDNPLAVFSLGRVYLKQGKPNLARVMFQDAIAAYSRAGWVPQGPRDLLARTGAPQRAAARLRR